MRGTREKAAQGRRPEKGREEIGERLKGLTQFTRQVLFATSRIPKGETRTYKQIAVAIGRPRAFRAVGSALRKNPCPIAIPCHRVIRSDGKPGGYSDGGTRAKRRFLMREGAIEPRYHRDLYPRTSRNKI